MTTDAHDAGREQFDAVAWLRRMADYNNGTWVDVSSAEFSRCADELERLKKAQEWPRCSECNAEMVEGDADEPLYCRLCDVESELERLNNECADAHEAAKAAVAALEHDIDEDEAQQKEIERLRAERDEAIKQQHRAVIALDTMREGKCTGCDQPRSHAIQAALDGKVACCPDCSTLTVRERNQIRAYCGELRDEIERLREKMLPELNCACTTCTALRAAGALEEP